MTDGFPNKPKILRGAFMEYGIHFPPLFVVFQFNPEQLTRSHSNSYSGPGNQFECPPAEGETRPRIYRQQESLREFHQREYSGKDDLTEIRRLQKVGVQEQSINFDIRLDATDKLNDGDAITGLFGLSPQIAALETMMAPLSDTPFGAIADLLGLGGEAGFTPNKQDKPPIILFIWGLKRILPVNLTSMNITESEFSTDLSTTRATVSVSMNVIEGNNLPYGYSRAVQEVMTTLNLVNITDIANIVIPA